jgi:hypothetical protein
MQIRGIGMGGNCFSEKELAKGGIKAVILYRTVQNRKLWLGSPNVGPWKAYEALRYTLGVH